MSKDDQRPSSGKSDAAAEEPISGTVETTLRRIAHELRTPIGAIVSSADLMKSEAFGPLGDARYGEYATSIANSAEFALSVVAQAIEDLEAAAASKPIRLADVDANDVIAKSIEQLQPWADDAGVQLETRLASGQLLVLSDAIRLEQIVINATMNAIKFSPVGAHVTIASQTSGRSRATIEVKDRGLGMGEALLAGVRANQSDHGQGYQLMHRLSALAGAQLAVDSERGEGTLVRIELALASDR
ncbi:MAG: HAMP domain-containing sensor histidine kinase [Pseudomonadota bacterium]